MRYTRLVCILFVLMSLLGSSLLMANAQGDKVVITTTLGPGDISTTDPALATDNASHQIILMNFVGLTSLNEETLETEPGIAESWEVSEDGLTYTFHLMQNVPWVRYNTDSGEVEQVTDEAGNVRMVTAHDFEYGMKRLLDPVVASEYAYVTAEWVAGAAEFNAGEGSVDDVAITAVDDFTLEIVASDVAGFVPAILGLWFNAATPQWAIEEFGDQWIEPGNYQSYGPFTVSEWAHDESLTTVKNPFWPGTAYVPQAKLDSVVSLILEESAMLAEYEAGNVDHVTSVPLADLDRVEVEYADQYNNAPVLSTYYYGFNVTKPPVDNVHMRRALSYAVDRQSLVDNVTRAGQPPAHWFTNPNLAAAPTMETYPDLGISFDPEMAKSELQAYMDEMGFDSIDDIPPLTLMFNTSEAHGAIAEAIQQMWKDNLGLEVQLANQEFAVYLDTLNADPPQIWRLGWGADYPDAHNYASDVFRSDSGNNHTLWGSEEYDSLVDQAKVLTDNTERAALYAQTENILIKEEAVIIPLYWYTSSQLTSPNVTRTFPLTGTGGDRFEKWDKN